MAETSIEAETARGRPPAILQVLPSLRSGGVERGTVDVAKALAAIGWKAFVASEGGPMVRELERAGGVHLTLPLAAKNPLVMRANVGRLVNLIREHGIDIVHARSRAPAWSARTAARRCRVPFMTTYHGTYTAKGPLKWLYNSIMAKGDRVIAISDFIAGHVLTNYRLPPGRLVTVPRGIDLARFDPATVSAERMTLLAVAWRLNDGFPVVLLPGRLTRWKGHHVLIEAMQILVRHLGHKNLHAVLLGDDKNHAGYRRELEQAVAQRGLDGVVRLAEHCRDMPAAYMLADVVVSPSVEPEAFGRIPVEAQAMGRPVIATDHGGARETVRGGTTGWLVPPGDAHALAEALAGALDLDMATRSQLAMVARAHIGEHFTVQRMCQATLGVYADLLQGV